MKTYRGILKISWVDRLTNVEVLRVMMIKIKKLYDLNDMIGTAKYVSLEYCRVKHKENAVLEEGLSPGGII